MQRAYVHTNFHVVYIHYLSYVNFIYAIHYSKSIEIGVIIAVRFFAALQNYYRISFIIGCVKINLNFANLTITLATHARKINMQLNLINNKALSDVIISILSACLQPVQKICRHSGTEPIRIIVMFLDILRGSNVRLFIYMKV